MLPGAETSHLMNWAAAALMSCSAKKAHTSSKFFDAVGGGFNHRQAEVCSCITLMRQCIAFNIGESQQKSRSSFDGCM